jgi:hypothetical protein
MAPWDLKDPFPELTVSQGNTFTDGKEKVVDEVVEHMMSLMKGVTKNPTKE